MKALSYIPQEEFLTVFPYYLHIVQLTIGGKYHMPERNERMNQVPVEFVWRHPENNCIMRQYQPTITRSITGMGISPDEARKNARILAENSPQICEGCRQNYTLQ
jgi:hypothetical protein